ncbi:MAG: PhzF family phenazine biosynthesis protein [Deltaproteobacteria bacterium]|jgi:PhzF family phenazine biosynthesis protein|nr:PhzF family phenazine biosynthesis protein [Deltaproteobacteria bacterium]
MKLFQVDVFTSQKFKGNPAGVCLTDKFLEVSLMQSLSSEINASETAFIELNNGNFNIRYFTPAKEIPLCGHATLAGAHILYEQNIIKFQDKCLLHATKNDILVYNDNNWITITFPVYDIKYFDSLSKFKNILNLIPIEAIKSDNNFVVARFADWQDIVNISVNFDVLKQENFAEILAVTAPSPWPDYDFVVRVFCHPDLGVTEDPVTGVINCILAPYWQSKLNKSKLISKQLSKRTGILKFNIIDDKVEIKGQAITVLDMKLL